jgi:hypothetical protein
LIVLRNEAASKLLPKEGISWQMRQMAILSDGASLSKVGAHV